jgi:hypothetical protein
MRAGQVLERQVRTLFTARTVTVYQAYAPEIADRALAAGTFVPPFKLGRMTWIKPRLAPATAAAPAKTVTLTTLTC